MTPRAEQPVDLHDQSRSGRKRSAILDAATNAFLSKGYLGTSMDEIAAVARVSKQTVYKHFADKESLFIEIVTSSVNEISDPVYEEVVRLADNSGNIEADLRDLARRLLARVMTPRLLELRRLVIAEANRFPDLGHAFHERGPQRTISALASVFEQLAAGGTLRLDDPKLAAAHFNWLIMSAPVNQVMMLGSDSIPGRRDLNRYADSGVEAFLAAYRSA